MSSRIKDYFKRTASKLALQPMLAKLGLTTEPKYTVTANVGAKGAPNRYIIRHEQATHYTQTGWRSITQKVADPRAGHEGEMLVITLGQEPIMERIIYHTFYHATKGYRTYRNGLPVANPPRFLGLPRNPAKRWEAHSKRGVTVENKKGAKRQ